MPGPVICPITGLVIERLCLRQRFISATQLKNLHAIDRHTFNSIAAQFLTVKMVHNIRNAYAS